MDFKIYDYKYQNVPILTKYNAEKILKGVKKISLNLGISEETIEIDEEKVIIRGIDVERSVLEKIKNDDGTNIFLVFEDGVKKALFFDNGVYKLRLVRENTAPTLEINGIHMHRIKHMTPWEDAKRKVKEAEIKKGERVLDICTGLGYTAINAFEKGGIVDTVELDKNVLFLAEYNPWSKKLEEDEIRIIVADAFEFVKSVREEYSKILHDPPRKAPILYSRPFYKELLRIMESGGRLVHYVGSPKRREYKFHEMVEKRLKDAGFRIVKYVEDIEVVVAEKP